MYHKQTRGFWTVASTKPTKSIMQQRTQFYSKRGGNYPDPAPNCARIVHCIKSPAFPTLERWKLQYARNPVYHVVHNLRYWGFHTSNTSYFWQFQPPRLFLKISCRFLPHSKYLKNQHNTDSQWQNDRELLTSHANHCFTPLRSHHSKNLIQSEHTGIFPLFPYLSCSLSLSLSTLLA